MTDVPPTAARRAAELAAIRSYGRLVALLASRTRDVAAAEDALSDAFATALATWPLQGVPERPEAWLLVVARRKASNRVRHQAVVDAAVPDVLQQLDERGDSPRDDGTVLDERLALMFVCAHPAIDAAIRTPLMLQTVLGLDAARIASAFLVAPATMGQRLVRAKTKIKAAGIPFVVPDAHELPDRLDDVLSAVYAAYGTGWDDLDGGRGLTEEAVFLARLLVEQMPDEPEPRGLLALMLYCEARRDARRDAAGRFVPLARQDPARWHRELIVEAERHLVEASRAARFGRFQCEAAIQSVHAQRAITGVTQYPALVQLYDLLLAEVRSTGVDVARAATLLEAGELARAREALDALPEADVAAYQPYWVTRARLAELAGEPRRALLERALGLTEDAAVRAYLQDQLARAR